MQDLKEIILLLVQHNIQPFRRADAKSKLLALWDGIAMGNFSTDAAAAKALYDESFQGSKYRKLKSDFRARILNAVLEIDGNQKTYSDYQRAYYDCHRQWAMVRILTGQNANAAAVSIATRLLRQAEKFDFTLLAMDIASYLRIQYGLRESNDRKFREAHEVFERYRKTYDAENLAEALYTTLIVRYVNNRSTQPEVSRLATEYWEQISPYMLEHATYKLQMYGYMIGLMRYTAANDYEKALVACNEAIQFFKGRVYEARVPLQIFYYQRLICNIQLRQFEEGTESADYCLKILQKGTFNWFKNKELYLQLSLHTGEFGRAADILYETLHHARFEFLPENVKETWSIYEAFFYYLVLAGKAPAKTNAQKFKLAKIINAPPLFSKDKSGIIIAIMVVKMLLLLQERRFSQVLDEVEAVEQYCYRHLRGVNAQRSYFFLKMLLQIPTSGFDPVQSVAKAERFLKKLKETRLQVANQTHEIEVVPYEMLWEIAIESLSSAKKVA
ncbi:MAG: hypothetical protein Q7T20_01575 [Saprospiraceae bacterium]|nr:hypothetical protein [Saprospiraceae bacterium]